MFITLLTLQCYRDIVERMLWASSHAHPKESSLFIEQVRKPRKENDVTHLTSQKKLCAAKIQTQVNESLA